MKADGRALDQAERVPIAAGPRLRGGRSGTRRPDPDPRAGDAPPPFGGFGGFGEVASGMIWLALLRRRARNSPSRAFAETARTAKKPALETRIGWGNSGEKIQKLLKIQQYQCHVAERFVVPLKPGNAGGGKGPQFKTDAIRSEGPGDWETYQLR